LTPSDKKTRHHTRIHNASHSSGRATTETFVKTSVQLSGVHPHPRKIARCVDASLAFPELRSQFDLHPWGIERAPRGPIAVHVALPSASAVACHRPRCFASIALQAKWLHSRAAKSMCAAQGSSRRHGHSWDSGQPVTRGQKRSCHVSKTLSPLRHSAPDSALAMVAPVHFGRCAHNEARVSSMILGRGQNAVVQMRRCRRLMA